MKIRFAAVAVLALALARISYCAEAAGGASVKVIDDFESSRIDWSGDYVGGIVTGYASHGEHSFKVLFRSGVQYPGIAAGALDLDWAGYDTLRLDIYNQQGVPVNLAVRIDDDRSDANYSSRYNGEFLLVNGQTFLEVPFSKITAGDRPLNFSRIRAFIIFMTSPEKDTVLYLDSIRVTKGPEGDSSKGRTIPVAAGGPAIDELMDKASAARDRLAAVHVPARRTGLYAVHKRGPRR